MQPPIGRDRGNWRRVILALIASIFLFAAVPSQQPLQGRGAAEVVELALASKFVGRELKYRVVLPPGYKEAAGKYPAVYLLHGLDGHFDNWVDRTRLVSFAREHDLVIVTPEGENSWYTDSPAKPSDRFETYILKELIPTVESRFKVQADREHRFIAGLSMGGYGSIKYALKYPEMFSIVGSFSGALGAARFTEQANGRTGKSVDDLYGGTAEDHRSRNDVFKLLADLPAERIRSLPFIYLSCGTEDTTYLPSSRSFNQILIERKVPHEYRERPGAHSWAFWGDQVREFLHIVTRRVTKTY